MPTVQEEPVTIALQVIAAVARAKTALPAARKTAAGVMEHADPAEEGIALAATARTAPAPIARTAQVPTARTAPAPIARTAQVPTARTAPAESTT